MSNKSGRKPKHWAERARVAAWYNEVKKRGWTDYQLNNEFALTEAAKAKKLPYQEPVRTFDSIRKHGRQPTRGRHWRSEHDLIRAVDQHPLFSGTQVIYTAAIWDLFQEEITSGEVVAQRVSRILEKYSLTRIDPMLSVELTDNYSDVGPQKLFDHFLVISLTRMEYWDQIVLLWSLFQQAMQSCSWDICDVLEKKIDCWVDVFFATKFSMKEYNIFYSEAMHALLSWRVRSPSIGDTLGQLKNEVSWPILSRDIAAKLTPSTW